MPPAGAPLLGPDFAATNGNGNHNPDDKKIVLFVGRNAPAHYVMSHAVKRLTELGVHVDVYLLQLPNKKGIQRKIQLPEAQNFAFYEALMVNHGYNILQGHATQTTKEGELHRSLVYTPRQLADHPQTAIFRGQKGATVRIRNYDGNVNATHFVESLKNDDSILAVYNIRGMHIWNEDLINACTKTHKGNEIPPRNLHPGDPLRLPGTYCPLWNRALGYEKTVWTLHLLTKGIDEGPILDQVYKALKMQHGNLIRDMLAMDDESAGMIVKDVNLLLEGTPRTPIAQENHDNFNNKPPLFSYATHAEWNAAYAAGIMAVDPDGLIKAFLNDYTMPGTGARRELDFVLRAETYLQQIRYLNNYLAQHGYYPPDFDPEEPSEYFIFVPEGPPKGKIFGENPPKYRKPEFTVQKGARRLPLDEIKPFHFSWLKQPEPTAQPDHMHLG
ncbi:MAG: hypothetical protein ACPGRX_02455 [Bdellovibrionales bacterium]